MDGKRRAQPSGDAHGKAAAGGDVTAAQGGVSQKRRTRGLMVGSGAGSVDAGSSGQDESWWMDTVQRVLEFLLPFVGPEGAVRCFHVCKSWRGELEAVGFCDRTVQICSALAEGWDVERLQQNAQRRLGASSGDDIERALYLDGDSFLETFEGWEDGGALLEKSDGWEGTLQEWLQAASQEPDASFLSRGQHRRPRASGWR